MVSGTWCTPSPDFPNRDPGNILLGEYFVREVFCETWVFKTLHSISSFWRSTELPWIIKGSEKFSKETLKSRLCLIFPSFIEAQNTVHMCAWRASHPASVWGVLGDSSAWCLVFLSIWRAEALPTFGLDYLSKGIFTGNNLG